MRIKFTFIGYYDGWNVNLLRRKFADKHIRRRGKQICNLTTKKARSYKPLKKFLSKMFTVNIGIFKLVDKVNLR